MACKPKSQKRDTNLNILTGHVALKPMPMMPQLTINDARHLAEDLTAAIGNAETLEDFLTARFGPAD